jgi:hypothetical protein
MLALHLITSSASTLYSSSRSDCSGWTAGTAGPEAAAVGAAAVGPAGGGVSLGPCPPAATWLPAATQCLKPAQTQMHASSGPAGACGGPPACREGTPPPAPADAPAGRKIRGGGGGSAYSAADDASPDASSTPLCWALAAGMAGGDGGGAAAAAEAPAGALACARAADAAAAGEVAAAAARGKRGRGPSDAGDGRSGLPFAPPAGRPEEPQQQLYEQRQPRQHAFEQLLALCDCGSSNSGTPDELLQVQRSDGSGSSSSSSVFALARAASGGGGALALAARRHQQQEIEYLQLISLMDQQQQWQQLKAAAAAGDHHQQQQVAHAVALSLAAAQQQQGRRRLTALRPAAPPALKASAPVPAALVGATDAAFAWAGSVLGIEAREVFLFARHIWARAAGRVDELLVVSLGASQAPSRAALLVALWLASKLEGSRRQVAGASRLCAATGLSRWGVTAVEVHLLQLLDFSPYRGW